MPLRPAALPDQSMTLQIPQGWSLQGQKLQFTTFDNPQTKQRGVGSGSHDHPDPVRGAQDHQRGRISRRYRRWGWS